MQEVYQGSHKVVQTKGEITSNNKNIIVRKDETLLQDNIVIVSAKPKSSKEWGFKLQRYFFPTREDKNIIVIQI